MIFSYNKAAVGDVLMIVVANAEGKEVAVERKGNIARVFLLEDNQTVGINVFEASSLLNDLEGNGQVFLTNSQQAIINEALKTNGFEDQIDDDGKSKIVVGYVMECHKHEDSDHLSVTQIDVGHGEVLQIVCGAPNIAAGQKVVVAKPGAMMPNGLIIWSGNLRGVDSFGMVCSAKELHLPNAPKEKGILVLPEDAEIGQSFVR